MRCKNRKMMRLARMEGGVAPECGSTEQTGSCYVRPEVLCAMLGGLKAFLPMTQSVDAADNFKY